MITGIWDRRHNWVKAEDFEEFWKDYRNAIRFTTKPAECTRTSEDENRPQAVVIQTRFAHKATAQKKEQ